MNKVYIVIGSTDYEGDTVIDVFSDEQSADKEAEQYSKWDSIRVDEFVVKGQIITGGVHTCPTCKGKCLVDAESTVGEVSCPDCQGSGSMIVVDVGVVVTGSLVKCPECKGYGYIKGKGGSARCTRCEGSGVIGYASNTPSA